MLLAERSSETPREGTAMSLAGEIDFKPSGRVKQARRVTILADNSINLEERKCPIPLY